MSSSQNKITHTRSAQHLIELIEEGQSGKFGGFIRKYSGRIRQMLELKNPLDGAIIVDDIAHVVEILNPELEAEIDWFDRVRSGLKEWVNDKITSNRLLGIKDVNQYDMRQFEKIVLLKFMLSKKPKRGTIIETDFETLVEMVETGARRFGH